MTTQEHLRLAYEYLEVADQQFAADDELQGSEKMWGAVSHAIMALAQQRGWKYGTHRVMLDVARRLADERGDKSLYERFLVAEKFHANFHHGFMDDFELDANRPVANEYVRDLLSLMSADPASN